MKSVRRALAVAALSLVIFAVQRTGWLAQTSHQLQKQAPGTYAVTTVHDGDTFGVDMNGTKETIRLIGVDTPETRDPRKPVQCYGQAAAAFTAQLLSGQRVRLEADPLSTNRDRYSRLLRYAYTTDNRLVNAEIIKHGYGFAYTSFPFGKADEFKRYEQAAREAGKGLWGSCTPRLDSRGFIHTNPAQ